MKISLLSILAILCGTTLSADPLKCDLSGYKAAPGLTAAVSADVLALTWDGEKGQEVRMRLAINGGTPTIQDLALRKAGGQWGTLVANVAPDFRVTSGLPSHARRYEQLGGRHRDAAQVRAGDLGNLPERSG